LTPDLYKGKLVSPNSYTMEVNETSLVTDILLNIRKLAECIWKWWNSTF